ncbi:serine dehydratase [Aureimonas ureilytica]|uniref:L-serine dehydratase n=1 Tax=Aureimonas ureilytica TaxID=401562 RepID=A0A175RN76_9HYPH|nr:L-serine ammonia-lyase [Aureimonas ureilytica]KTR04292.1 serine dehydratase [Aureimonas ureilytica]
MFLSVFDLYKIGIGPSSSHTMGPMTAAARFLAELKTGQWPRPQGAIVHRLRAILHGSLAFTGVGHATDRAVVLGLAGYTPATIDPDDVEGIVSSVTAKGEVQPGGHPAYAFDPARDLVFDRARALPGHANGLAFEALDRNGAMLLRRVYYSIGGGFVVDEDELSRKDTVPPAGEAAPGVPYPFTSASEMLAMAARSGLSIAEMQRENELTLTSAQDLDARLDAIAETMADCIRRGIRQEGIMPGGLKIRRRAKAIHDKLQADAARNVFQPLLANDWLSVYAMAVNEENACGGRVVTAPTNGAAGVVPAVLQYVRHFHTDATKADLRTFLLTSAAIGGIIKRNASISGAEVGCQGEVGSASAMAAAGLAALMGANPLQVENAAEIALEHHLGMTCDPVRGLVQVPCIERNAFGAVKAVTAASLAMKGEGLHFVPLDACIETMRQTGLDMDHRYKETSLGGLAVNLPEC